MRTASFALAWIVVACGGGNGGIGSAPTPSDGGSGAAPSGSECALGDAKDCMVMTTTTTSTGPEGPCLRLVYENRCGRVVYTNTRIEHTTTKGNKWQGWISTTFAGASLDLDQCGATGRYTNIASFGDARLDELTPQCPLPE